MTPKQQALFCISQSIHVIAGYPVGKSERAIIKGTAEGTLNEDLVNAWFDEIPNRNVLINLKNSNLICIDLDQHKDGQNGVKAFSAIWKENSQDKKLDTYVEKTPTGSGVHIFFKVPNIVKVDKAIDLRILGPLGCGLGTGSGAVLKVLHPKAGESIAVFGTGAVGFAALMAAKIAGCKTIIALDINEARLETAKKLGATHVINSGIASDQVLSKVREITNGEGVDYTIDTSGVQPVMKQAMAVLANGGTFVPLAVTNKNLELNTFFDLVFGNKKIVGCLIGDTIPRYHLPRLIDFYKAGNFPFDQFIKFYDFEDIVQAEADSVSGKTLKSVVVMDKSYQPPTANA